MNRTLSLREYQRPDDDSSVVVELYGAFYAEARVESVLKQSLFAPQGFGGRSRYGGTLALNLRLFNPAKT